MPRSAQPRHVTRVTVVRSSDPLDLPDLASLLARALLAGGGAPLCAGPAIPITPPDEGESR